MNNIINLKTLAREEWVARRTIPIKCSKPPENTLFQLVMSGDVNNAHNRVHDWEIPKIVKYNIITVVL